MGGTDFHTVAIGKTAKEAFSGAREQAGWDHGHAGYSGTIYEKHDFVLYDAPPRLSVDKLLGWVEQFQFNEESEWLKQNLEWLQQRLAEAKPGTKRELQRRVRDAKAAIKKNEKDAAKFRRELGPHYELVRKMSEVYNDKWGPAVGVEVTSPTQKKRYLRGARLPRGAKIFIFTGVASS